VLTSLEQLLFYIANIFYFFYKTSYHKKEVSCTEPSPSVTVPWFQVNKTSSTYISGYPMALELAAEVTYPIDAAMSESWAHVIIQVI
jgi:hypothetical protein